MPKNNITKNKITTKQRTPSKLNKKLTKKTFKSFTKA